MQTVKAQMFYQAEGEEYEMGDPVEIEVTDEELEKLQQQSPTYIARLGETYGLLEDEGMRRY